MMGTDGLTSFAREHGTLTTQDLKDVLASMVEDRGAGATAVSLGITKAYLWQLRNGNAPISKAVAERMGYERIDAYIPIEDEVSPI